MKNDLEKLAKNFEKLTKDIPKIMEELAVGEGVRIVDEAKKITDEEKIYRPRNYKRSWHSDDKAKVSGDTYAVEAGNTAEYTEWIEKGFKRHFVPGYWEDNIFVYDRNSKTGAAFGPMKGRWVLKRASDKAAATRKARLERNVNKKINKYLKEGLND